MWWTVWMWGWLLAHWHRIRQHRRFKRSGATIALQERRNNTRFRRKPPWVVHEVIRLKAWSPELSCYKIADAFNRQFAHRRESVGKSYVNTLLRQRKLDILRLRRTLKHRIPKPTPRNRTWALDLTGKTELSGRQRMILGLLDHGTRACLRLRDLPDKSSLSILAELIAAFRQYGIPNVLRTDNEACFVSRTMRLALGLLGIRHQRTDLHCPWQNGRIERFFGTLKEKLDRIAVLDGDDLRCKLIEFRCWYNHVRSHRHLDGRTPAEAWAGRAKSTGRPQWFSAWEERLTGWYFPP
jgi:transposase InsO family protein